MLMEDMSLSLYGSEERTALKSILRYSGLCFSLFYWNLGVSYLLVASNTGNQFYKKFTLQG